VVKYSPVPELEYLWSYDATLAPPEVIGPVAEGIRANFYVTGGTLQGRGRDGRLRPVGGDWLTIRPDGVAVLDVRTTIEMTDGALIDTSYRGIGDLGPDGYGKFLRGDLPSRLALTIMPILQSAHADYQWLQRSVFVGIGSVEFATLTVAYDLYIVR
jgi:hypothetical protein